MKSSYARGACALVLATGVFVSCGSDDQKVKVTVSPGGAAGEAGQAGESAGGSSFIPPGGAGGVPAVTEGGMGGVALAPVGGAGGAGGEGGQGPAPLCFDVGNAGGAGGARAAAQGGAGSQAVPFRCEGMTGSYDPATRHIRFDVSRNLEPAVSGTFTAHHNKFESSGICYDGQVVRSGQALELALESADEPYNYIWIFSMELKDACGGSLELDTTPTGVEDCFGIRVSTPDPVGGEPWVIDCVEGYGSDCAPGCPPPIIEAKPSH